MEYANKTKKIGIRKLYVSQIDVQILVICVRDMLFCFMVLPITPFKEKNVTSKKKKYMKK